MRPAATLGCAANKKKGKKGSPAFPKKPIYSIGLKKIIKASKNL
jgi:hypothetical protein